MGEIDRPGEFEDVPPDYREKILSTGMIDMGNGKCFMTVDDKVVNACRGSRDYCADVIHRARALARNIKDNGADFEETWAGFLALGKTVDVLNQGPYELLAYLLTEEVFNRHHCASCDGWCENTG